MSGRAQRGETLVEVLVSLGVISIIISLCTALYVQMFAHYNKTASDVDAQSEARFAMGRVTQALRQAGTDPNQPPGPPISYPTPIAGGGTPVPQATSVTFTDISSMPSDANYQNAVYQTVTIQTAATPPPGHTYPDLLVTTYDSNGHQTSQTIIGRDVSNFVVMPVTQSIYDVQITCQPPVGMSQNGGTPSPGFTLNSRVYISYYQ